MLNIIINIIFKVNVASLLRVAEDRRRWVAVTAEASVGYPNDAWA